MAWPRAPYNLNQMGKTIILVTHEDEVSAHAKRVIRLRDGLVQSDILNEQRRAIKPTAHAIPTTDVETSAAK